VTILIDGVVFVISIFRNAKILYLDIYKLLMVNYVSLTEKR
jgi:hypothetical protein